MMYNLPSSGQGFRCVYSCMDESVLILNTKWASFIYERIEQRDCTKCLSNVFSLCKYFSCCISRQKNCKEFFQVYWTHVTTTHTSSVERFSENFDQKAVIYLIFFDETHWFQKCNFWKNSLSPFWGRCGHRGQMTSKPKTKKNLNENL